MIAFRWIGTAMSVGVALGAAGAASAQPTGSPWATLAGCYTPVGAEGVTLGRDGASAVTFCVIPVARDRGVLARYSGDKLIEADTVIIDVEQRKAAEDGCEVSTRTSFAADYTRLYVRAARNCTNGAVSQSSGLLGLSPGGDLLDVREITRGSKSAAIVQRFTPAETRPELAGFFERLTRSDREARVLASARLTGADLIEAAAMIDSTAVAAWLAERGQGFMLNANTLTALSKASVPANVIDMMVALSNPKEFVVDRPSATVALRPRPNLQPNGTVSAMQGWGNQWGVWDPMMMGPWGMGIGRGRLGFMNQLGVFGTPWGNGFGYGWGWDPWFNPWFGNNLGNGVIVVGNGNVTPQRAGGRIDGDGYSGSGATPSGRAVRRGGDSGGYPASSTSGGSGSGVSWGSAQGSSAGGGSSTSAGVSSGGYSSGGGGGSSGSAKGRPPL
jgi:hypothetical protein